MINVYNANTEKEQINVLSILLKLSEEFDTNPKKQLMAGDFNLFFNSKLDAQGGNPSLRKKSLAKLIDFKENYDLCGTWEVRITESKRFTFIQKHSAGFIQRRLYYISGSNTLEEYATTTKILTPISTDHSCTHFFQKKKKKKTIRCERY